MNGTAEKPEKGERLGYFRRPGGMLVTSSDAFEDWRHTFWISEVFDIWKANEVDERKENEADRIRSGCDERQHYVIALYILYQRKETK